MPEHKLEMGKICNGISKQRADGAVFSSLRLSSFPVDKTKLF